MVVVVCRVVDSRPEPDFDSVSDAEVAEDLDAASEAEVAAVPTKSGIAVAFTDAVIVLKTEVRAEVPGWAEL